MTTSEYSNDTPRTAEQLSTPDARQASRRVTDTRLSSALAAGEVGAWSWETDTQRVICDEYAAQLLSIDPGIVLGGITIEVFFQAVLAADHEAALLSLVEAWVPTKRHETDYRVRQASGEVLWLRSRGRVVLDQNGKVVGRHGVVMDVTAQKYSEKALHTTTQLLEVSQSIALLGGWELDVASGQLYWTQETYRIHDVSPDTFNPTVDAGVGYYLPESRQIISAALNAAMTDGTGYDLELETLTAKGRLVNVRTTCLVTSDKGRPVKLTGIVQDITEQKRAAKTLHESEDQFRMLLQGTSDMVTITDAEGRFTYVNNQTARYMGLEVVDLIGQSALTFIHPDDHALSLKWFADSIAVGEAQDSFEVRFVHRDGSARYSSWVAKLHFDDKDLLTHISIIAHDTTERRQVLEGREYLAAIVDNSEDAIIGKTLDGNISSWNAGAKKLFGYSAEEIIGTPVACLIPDDVHVEELEILARMDAGEMDKHFETIRRSKDGRLIQVSAMISPIKDADGLVIGAAGIFRDITDRKLAEAAARESQARIALAMQIANIGPWDWDLVTNDVDFSVEWKAQLGFSDEEVPNGFSEIESRLHPEDRDRVMAAVAASIEDPSVVYSADFRLRHKDGSYRWMHGRALIVLDEQGRPVRMIGAHVDLTEQKNAEKQSFRSQRLESLGTLASGVAHDLNNALTPILMSIEMLRMDYPNETAVIDLVESNALRGANMVRQLLTFPRGVSSERVGVDVGLLITEIQNLMQGTFPKNLELRVTCESTLPIVLGDATQLHQVLLNLCVNARDAMPDGGTLTIDANYQRFQSPPIDTVTLAEPGDYIVVTVRDTGIGIPAEICEHIFDPFFTTKDVHKGTGLGLANVLAIVKGHSGFIKVQSQPEEGTTFTVFLPTRDDIRVLPSLVMQERVPHGRGELILFIEDEATIREVIAKGLARLNYRILTAVDGADGLAQVLDTNNDIAAVVTDMHMPNMDGLAMAQALRQHRPDMPILVTSGRMDDEVVAELYSLGVTQLLAKPFTKNQLALALEKLLQ